MRKQLIVTHTAKSDLRHIYNHIAKDNPQRAKTFVEELAAKIEWIADTDFTGSPRDYVAEDLRMLLYHQRCIYYRSTPDQIIILRVLHSSQDVAQVKF
ncbi:MAG: type II toxin-antitoxin system RelE/ParE family toxin [Alphaproteobacteria bacterium]|nr:type II toxin-antitoxin system RelE/ParE family toxin [Alphaproteobacteria bacterium]MDD9919770.1 type II toxin-antitoxin system RelE/ParE family toxin [Alphaproteobacteria bacterium]